MKTTKSFINNKVAIIIICSIALINSFTILTSGEMIGKEIEWEQMVARAVIARETIIHYKQIPLWNPFFCGGTSMIGDIQNSFLSPFFTFIILFKEIYGFKIIFFLSMLLGLIGMYYFCKDRNLSIESAIFSASIFMLASNYALNFFAGPGRTLYMSFLPWILLFYFRSLKSKQFIDLNLILTSVFISFLFFSGAPYILTFTITTIILLSIFKPEITLNDFKKLGLIILLFALLSSIQLIPAIEFHTDFPRVIDETYNYKINSFEMLLESLLTHKDISSKYNGKGIWEFEIYISAISIIFLLLGMMFRYKKHKEYLLTGLLFAIYFIHKIGSFKLNNLFHYIPFFSWLQIPSRSGFIIVFCIAIIAGEGFDFFKDKINKIKILTPLTKKIIPLIIISIFLIHLISVNHQINNHIENKFNKQNNFNKVQTEFYHYENSNYNSADYYSQFLLNRGLKNCHLIGPNPEIPASSAIPPKVNNLNIFNQSEITIIKNNMPIKNQNDNPIITQWTPNKITILTTKEYKTIVWNMNYYKGWTSKQGKVFSYQGLVAINSSEEIIQIRYRPNSFIIGTIISILTFIIIILKLFHMKKTKD